MRASITIRAAVLLLLFAALFLVALPRCQAQDDSEPSLGDLARKLRKQAVPAKETVIDNDNMSQVIDEVETRRMAGWTPFAIAPAVQSIRISSPDVMCSLSYTGKNASPDADLIDDLPRSELAKLTGPATIDGDSLQVSIHNGSAWDLREIVIGLTIVNTSPSASASISTQARIIPAAASVSSDSAESSQKQPDVTLILHAKGLAAPASAAVFRTALNFALFPDQEWHWAIVRAKGIPPQQTDAVATQFPDSTAQPASPPNPAILQSPAPRSADVPSSVISTVNTSPR